MSHRPPKPPILRFLLYTPDNPSLLSLLLNFSHLIFCQLLLCWKPPRSTPKYRPNASFSLGLALHCPLLSSFLLTYLFSLPFSFCQIVLCLTSPLQHLHSHLPFARYSALYWFFSLTSPSFPVRFFFCQPILYIPSHRPHPILYHLPSFTFRYSLFQIALLILFLLTYPSPLPAFLFSQIFLYPTPLPPSQPLFCLDVSIAHYYSPIPAVHYFSPTHSSKPPLPFSVFHEFLHEMFS